MLSLMGPKVMVLMSSGSGAEVAPVSGAPSACPADRGDDVLALGGVEADGGLDGAVPAGRAGTTPDARPLLMSCPGAAVAPM